MKVLHQVNNLAIGGVETFVSRLCKYSNEEVFVYSHEDGIVGDWLTEMQVPVFTKKSYDIIELIDRLKIDVLVMHTGSYLPEYALEVRNKFPKLKMVTVMHTVYPGDEWVDKIICISQAVKDVNNHEKSILIYPGIDRRQKFVIGEITRIAPYKYLEDLIQVAKALVEKYPEVLFRIIGEDAQDSKGYTEHLKRKLKDIGLENNFEFMGYVDKIDYSWFDAFVHLVGDEAYPVTLLEALNANLPTFTYLRRGTKEIEHPLLVQADELSQVVEILSNWIESRPKHIKQVADEFSRVYDNL